MADINVQIVEEQPISVTVDCVSFVSDSNRFVSVTCGELISAGKFLSIRSDGKSYMTDLSREEDLHNIFGISTQIGLESEIISAQVDGYIKLLGWNLGYGSQYLKENGVITNIKPTSGYSLKVGVAVDNNTLVIGIKEPELIT